MFKNFAVARPSATARETLLARCETWIAEGDYRQAIDYATAANRRQPDPVLEAMLLQWRQQAPSSLGPYRARADWPPDYAEQFPDTVGIPQIQAGELTTLGLGSALRHHGCLLVRGLLDSRQAAHRVEAIEQAFAALARDPQGSDGWYQRTALGSAELAIEARPWVESLGGILLADSPRNAFEYIDLLQQLGVIDTIAGYLGERPMLSVAKTTLRKVPPHQPEAGWHQDGAFLGAGIRSVNLWLSLSHCGHSASGLDVLPQRLHGLVETGSRDAAFPWSVAASVVAELAVEAPISSPLFAPGDALLFDELLLHRTGTPAGMRHDRYAIESWFFAPSSYPLEQGPIYV